MENRKVTKFIIDQKILIVIAAIVIFLSIRSQYFLTYYNIVNIFSFISIEGVIVIGMTFLMILGEIDLSVGAVMAFSTILAVLFQPFGVIVGVLAGIAGGALIGFANGILVTRLRLSSIPVTLGMMVLVNGIVFALTKSQSVKGTNPDFMKIAQPLFFNISGSIIILLVLVLVFEIHRILSCC